MSLLETLICLFLIAILSTVSVFGYQHLLLRTQVEADRQLVKTSLQEGRAKAGSVRCDNHHCLITTAQGERSIILSGKNSIETKLFPASAGDTFVFNPNGLTAYHNGTVYISPEGKPELGKKVVVSQGARIR